MPKISDVCRLCDQEAELENSHILPAAAHRVTKDNGRNVMAYVRGGMFNNRNQSDFAEPLLCYACEQKLSLFEGRAIKACREAWKHRDECAYCLPREVVRPLVEFGYSVFWRASVAKALDDYSLGQAIEDRLKAAFVVGEFPDPPALALSMSFLRVTGVTITNRILMTPWIERFTAGVRVSYFTVFGIVFRLHFPASIYELESGEFLRAHSQSGSIYPLKTWERKSIDDMFTAAAVHSKRNAY
jgi:hypothetical protein